MVKRQHKEYNYQVSLVSLMNQFNRALAKRGIRIIRFNGSQNGVPLPRNIAGRLRKQMVRCGAKKGHPDMIVYAASTLDDKCYTGLALELKSEKGRLDPEQKRYLEDLGEEGWYHTVSKSELEAKVVVFTYLAGVERCGRLAKRVLATIAEL